MQIVQTFGAIACSDSNLIVNLSDVRYFISKDNGDSWMSIDNLPSDSPAKVIAFKDSIILISTDRGFIYRSLDMGETWLKIKEDFMKYCDFCTVQIQNNILYFSAEKGLYSSTDLGLNWVPMREPDLSNQVNCFKIIDSTIVAGAHRDMRISKNGGKDWADFNDGLPQNIFNSEIFLETMNKNFILTNQNEVFISKEDLSGWTQLYHSPDFVDTSGNIYPSHINCTMVCGNTILTNIHNPLYSGYIYSTDLCKTWHEFNSGLSFNDSNAFRMFHNDEFIISASAPYFLRHKITNCIPDSTATEVFESPFGTVYLISPNPAEDFIEITKPSEGLEPSEGSVNAVRIFNVFGETVLKSSDLNNSQFSIHNSQLRIDVSGLPSGVYFVRIGGKVGKFVKL